MAEIKDLKAYVLVNPHNNRLTDNKIQNYPGCLPEYKVVFGPSIEDGIVAPVWYNQGTAPDVNNRGYCAYLGHFNAIKSCIDQYPESDILILEDDVEFDPNFNEYYRSFMKMVPDDWDAIYFGGTPTESKPTEVVQNVLRPGCIVGLECTILKNSMARYLLGALTFTGRKRITQVDVTLARLSKDKIIKVYMPVIKFAHQIAGYSAHFNRVDTDRNNGQFRYFKYIDINGEERQNSDEDLKRYESVCISKPEE